MESENEVKHFNVLAPNRPLPATTNTVNNNSNDVILVENDDENNSM